MSITVEIIGADTVAAKLQLLANRAADSKRAIYPQAQRTLTKAIGYTPVKYGFLRSSGVVDITGDAVEIKFGGPTAPYAVYVHEIMTNHHPIGQAKFLERAVQEDSKKFARAIANLIKTGGTP